MPINSETARAIGMEWYTRCAQSLRDRSIKTKLNLLTTLAAAVALLLSCVAFFTHDVRMIRASKARQLSALATVLGSNTTAALLATRTGAPTAVISCNRVGRGKFKLHVWDVIRTERATGSDADLYGITARINAALSRAILAYPGQWLWGSRRFLTRPPDESPGVDGLPPRAAMAGAAQAIP